MSAEIIATSPALHVSRQVWSLHRGNCIQRIKHLPEMAGNFLIHRRIRHSRLSIRIKSPGRNKLSVHPWVKYKHLHLNLQVGQDTPWYPNHSPSSLNHTRDSKRSPDFHTRRFEAPGKSVRSRPVHSGCLFPRITQMKRSSVVVS